MILGAFNYGGIRRKIFSACYRWMFNLTYELFNLLEVIKTNPITTYSKKMAILARKENKEAERKARLVVSFCPQNEKKLYKFNIRPDLISFSYQ
jgi:hypothetical protein